MDVLKEIHSDPRLHKLVKKHGIKDSDIEDLIEFMTDTVDLCRKLCEGMIITTCAVHKRLEDISETRSEVMTLCKDYTFDRLAFIVKGSVDERENFLRDLTLFARDSTQDVLGVN